MADCFCGILGETDSRFLRRKWPCVCVFWPSQVVMLGIIWKPSLLVQRTWLHKYTNPHTNKHTRLFTHSGAHAMVFEPYPFPFLSIFWKEPWYWVWIYWNVSPNALSFHCIDSVFLLFFLFFYSCFLGKVCRTSPTVCLCVCLSKSVCACGCFFLVNNTK